MKSEIKIGAIIGYISIIISTLVAILFTPILLKYLGTSDYGIYTLISSVMAYFTVLDLGLGSTAVRYISKNYDNEENINKINGFLIKIYLFIAIIALILGFIIYINASKIFLSLTSVELQKFKISLLIMTATVALSFPLSVCNSYIIAKEKFLFQKSVVLFQSIAKPLLMLPLLLFGYKSVALIVALAIINISTYFLNLCYSIFKLKIKVKFCKFSENKELLKEMFYFSFFIMLTMVVDTIFNNTDQVILAAYSGTAAVTIYNISMQFRSTNTNLSTVISQLFLPKLTKMVSQKRPINEFSEIFLKVSRIQLFILTLILAGFITFGDSFISFWVGKDFIEAYYIVIICLVPNLVPLSQNIGIYVLQAMNMHKFRSLVFFVIAILNIALSIPLSIKYAGIGAAIGTAIALLLGQILAMNFYYSKVVKLDIKSYWKNFIIIVVPSIVAAIIIKLIIKPYIVGWTTLFAYILLFIILYIGYTYLVIFNNYEKDLIKGLLNKLRRKKVNGKN